MYGDVLLCIDAVPILHIRALCRLRFILYLFSLPPFIFRFACNPSFMKKLKQIITDVKALIETQQKDELDKMLWQLICYPPRMPLRLQQEQLLNEAEKFSVTIYDEYFTLKNLKINAFKWGSGKHKVLISHGWGSKAADFAELITALRQNPALQIIAFDGPACGSSEIGRAHV